MPVCRNCNEEFATKAIIDGKKRNLQNRKYCLKCSPFGYKNRKQIHKDGNIVSKRCEPLNGQKRYLCNFCGKRASYKPYDKYKRTICRSCVTTIRRLKIKQKCVSYKGSKCSKCEYDKSLRALQFHHLDSSKKEFTIGMGNSRGKSWDRIKTELDKCILLCANCHAETHDKFLGTQLDVSPELYSGAEG